MKDLENKDPKPAKPHQDSNEDSARAANRQKVKDKTPAKGSKVQHNASRTSSTLLRTEPEPQPSTSKSNPQPRQDNDRDINVRTAHHCPKQSTNINNDVDNFLEDKAGNLSIDEPICVSTPTDDYRSHKNRQTQHQRVSDYFKPTQDSQTPVRSTLKQSLFKNILDASCHSSEMTAERDRNLMSSKDGDHDVPSRSVQSKPRCGDGRTSDSGKEAGGKNSSHHTFSRAKQKNRSKQGDDEESQGKTY